MDDHPQLGFSYRQPNLLLENTGSGRFVDATPEAGPGFRLVRASRGLAAGDYDDDGDLDLLISNLDEPPTLLRNDSEVGSWLTLVLEMSPGRGTVIGTQAVVTVGERKLIRDAASSGSYLSVHDHRLHFGLGAARTVDRIEVMWPDGHRTIRENVAADQFLTISREP